MNNTLHGYAGTSYNITAALATIALVFSPAVLLLSRPSGAIQTTIALTISTVCLAAAAISWRRYSTLTIPSIVA